MIYELWLCLSVLLMSEYIEDTSGLKLSRMVLTSFLSGDYMHEDRGMNDKHEGRF